MCAVVVCGNKEDRGKKKGEEREGRANACVNVARRMGRRKEGKAGGG